MLGIGRYPTRGQLVENMCGGETARNVTVT
jgi:hypothetical protein